MRLPILIVLFAVALAGCGKDAPKDDKEKDKEKQANPILAPAVVAGMGSPAQEAAQRFVIGIRKPDVMDLSKMSGRFLQVIGKPLTPNADDQSRKYSANEANLWLKRAGDAMGADAVISPTTGHIRDGAAVFVGSYKSAGAPKGRYLMRLVDEGNVWKLDWFQVSAIEAKDPPSELDPFKDFTAQAAADLIAGGPLTPQDRAPLAAALLSSTSRASLDVNQQGDTAGYDYKRDVLATKMETFLAGKAESYLRTTPETDHFKLEFTLAGGSKKTIEIRIATGDGPGRWVVEEIKSN